jgi:hypothetical protein
VVLYRDLSGNGGGALINNPALGGFEYSGTGTPEGVITANVGSHYHRRDGGALTSFYVKESGSGNTGWVAK